MDRSIPGPLAFIQTNVVGTGVLLDTARKHKVGRFVQISTEKYTVQWSKLARFTEQSPAAAELPVFFQQASADLLALAHFSHIPTGRGVTRCSNNTGASISGKVDPRS